jgi:hypothetical protein
LPAADAKCTIVQKSLGHDCSKTGQRTGRQHPKPYLQCNPDTNLGEFAHPGG